MWNVKLIIMILSSWALIILEIICIRRGPAWTEEDGALELNQHLRISNMWTCENDG